MRYSNKSTIEKLLPCHFYEEKKVWNESLTKGFASCKLGASSSWKVAIGRRRTLTDPNSRYSRSQCPRRGSSSPSHAPQLKQSGPGVDALSSPPFIIPAQPPPNIGLGIPIHDMESRETDNRVVFVVFIDFVSCAGLGCADVERKITPGPDYFSMTRQLGWGK